MKSIHQGFRPSYLTVIIIGSLLMRFFLLPSYPLMDPTESRYAEIAREMLALNDWVTPRLDPEMPFWGKPPLSFWLTASVYRLFGVNEATARISSYAESVVTLLLTMWLAGAAFGRSSAPLAGAILVTSALFFVQAGFVSTDSALGMCTTISLASIIIGRRCIGLRRRLTQLLFFVGLGLSLLAKGLIGAALILLPLIVWACMTGRTRRFRDPMALLFGAVVLLLLIVPWHIAAELRTPGFLKYYLIGEHLGRFYVSNWEGNLYGKSHSAPLGTIWLYWVAAIFPWCVPLLIGALSGGSTVRKRFAHLIRDENFQLLLLWSAGPLVLFTFARNILLPYVYPGVPACAAALSVLLKTEEFEDNERPRWSPPRLLMAAFTIVPVGFLIVATSVVSSVAERRTQRLLISTYNAAAADEPGELIYLSHKPYSADFYLQRTAKDLSRDPEDALMHEIEDCKSDYFVVRKEQAGHYAALLHNVRSLGVFGKYLLLHEQRESESPKKAA